MTRPSESYGVGLVKRLRSHWGSAIAQEAADYIGELIGKTDGWNYWFAWFPIETVGGRFVWLQTVERRWNWSLNHWGDFSGYSGTDGGWEYRLPIQQEDR